VRIKGSTYDGGIILKLSLNNSIDLGIVEFLEGSDKALVKLVPRIPDEAYADKRLDSRLNFRK
jgi:hypothetical protein